MQRFRTDGGDFLFIYLFIYLLFLNKFEEILRMRQFMDITGSTGNILFEMPRIPPPQKVPK